jgi:NAD(P)-dependent dehydrogenase (short-subunit alcohol dehydrogenase family)
MKIKGTAALITGASRGLGRALAAALAKSGARVVLVARNEQEVESAAGAIRAAGGEAHAIAADVGRPEDAAAIGGRAAALVGPIDILVHNASDLGPVPLELVLDTSREDFERAFRVNVFGPFALSRAIAGGMVLRGRGLVLHLSSDAAVNAYPRWGAYGASKAALDHLSRIFAEELARTGVRVLSIDPGEMDTRMHRDAIPEADPTTLARPEVVAEKIALLIEDERALTGARIAV